jgi:hypothetical protein
MTFEISSMEKYRQFAHSATGINPFLPPNLNNRPTFYQLRMIILAPLNVLRAVVLAILTLLLSVLDYFPRRDYLVSAISYLALLILGFKRIKSAQLDSRKLRVMLPHSNSTNYLLISQYQSAIDVLVLGWIAAPMTFGFLCTDGKVKSCRIINAVRLALETPPETGDISIDEFIKAEGLGLRVLFAEGVKTNGTGALTWPKGLKDQLVKFSNCGMAAIAYSSDSPACPNHCVGSAYEFILNLSLWFGYTAEVALLPPVASDDPRALFVRLASSIRSEAVADTNLTSARALEFRNFWKTTHTEAYVKKNT